MEEKLDQIPLVINKWKEGNASIRRTLELYCEQCRNCEIELANMLKGNEECNGIEEENIKLKGLLKILNSKLEHIMEQISSCRELYTKLKIKYYGDEKDLKDAETKRCQQIDDFERLTQKMIEEFSGIYINKNVGKLNIQLMELENIYETQLSIKSSMLSEIEVKENQVNELNLDQPDQPTVQCQMEYLNMMAKYQDCLKQTLSELDEERKWFARNMNKF